MPSYQVSREYVNRVNISNTTVNNTTSTNVYNTTIINKTTNITNVTYVNRNVQGAVTAVPQRAFASAQPVSRAVVVVNARDIASGKLDAPRSLLPEVHRLYFEPQYEELSSRTMWNLSNAFTSAFKKLDPIPQFKATAKLGEFLAQLPS